MSARRVYLVDDDAGFRESAGWWLESMDIEVESFDGPRACLAGLAPGGPGSACLLLDIRMPEMTGLQLAEKLAERGVELPVVYITGHADVPLAVAAMRRGAVSFLEKPVDEDALREALELAFAAAGGAGPATPEAEEYRQRLSSLTAREREVFDLIAEGRINKVIAYELGISIKTVELHRKRVMEKMQADSLPHLLRMAVTGEAAETAS
jgi:two-component system, LuxR family, response regulator FixJ